MIKSIIDEYRVWLISYLKEEKVSYKELASKLIQQLEKPLSIEQLKSILQNVADEHEVSLKTPSKRTSWFSIFRRSSEPAPDSDGFTLKLRSTLEEANKLAKAATGIDNISALIKTISAPCKPTKALISLLEKVVLTPYSYLYREIQGLLILLTEEKLQNLIAHLHQQPQRSPILRPRSGSFDALVPLNEEHRSVLALLRNNSATHGIRSSEGSDLANIFLQKLLILYQATYSPSLEVAFAAQTPRA